MSRYFARKTFERWLKKNRNRFNYPLKITKNRKDFFEFRFTGVNKHLYGFMNNNGDFGICVNFQDKCWDIVIEFDAYPRKNGKGLYCCLLCKDAYKSGYSKVKPILYQSKQDLWINHTFEPFLKWSNKNLRNGNRLCLEVYGEEGDWGITTSTIRPLKEIKSENFSFVLPLITKCKK